MAWLAPIFFQTFILLTYCVIRRDLRLGFAFPGPTTPCSKTLAFIAWGPFIVSYYSPCRSTTQPTTRCYPPDILGPSVLSFQSLPGLGTKNVAFSSFHKTTCYGCVASPTTTAVVYALYGAHQVPPGCVIPPSWDVLETLTQPSPSLHGKRVFSGSTHHVRLPQERPQRTALLVMAAKLTCCSILQSTAGRHQFPEQDP